MAHGKIFIISALLLPLIMVSGCLEGRKEAAQLRWQRAMDRVRIEAAQRSLEQGQVVYAERILEGCNQSCTPDPSMTDEMQQLLARVQDKNAHYIRADQSTAHNEDMIY